MKTEKNYGVKMEIKLGKCSKCKKQLKPNTNDSTGYIDCEMGGVSFRHCYHCSLGVYLLIKGEKIKIKFMYRNGEKYINYNNIPKPIQELFKVDEE